MNAGIGNQYGRQHPAAANSRVMIVEDDPWICSAIRRLVKSDGLQLEAFSSAEDFLQAATLENATCLILDVRLPGMSGLELQSDLAAARNPVPVIFISASVDPETRSRALRAGAIAFLNKPFNDEVLLSAIHAAIHDKEIQ